jgi:putative transposase
MGVVPRIARVAVSGLPHQVTKRGKRCEQTSFVDEDHSEYRGSMAASCANCGAEVRSWCLTPSHVHLVMVPSTDDGLGCAQGEAHRCYTRMDQPPAVWREHLSQDCFHSFVID